MCSPSVRVHATSASFMAACGELLLARLAMHQHLLSNATSVAADARLLLSVHQGPVVAAVVLAQVKDFVAATVGGELTQEAADVVVATARERNAALLARVSTSMGATSSRQAFADAFLRASPGLTGSPGFSLAAMELRGACAAAGPGPGGPRQLHGGLATSAEALGPLGEVEYLECAEAVLGTLVAWHQGFCRDALAAVEEPPSLERSREAMLAAAARGALYVWVTERGLVAMAAVGRQLLDVGVSLSLVYTPPEHRGNGYSKQLLSFMCAEISKQGKRVCLFADKSSNFGTVRLYEKLGFSNDGEYGDIRFSTVAAPP